MQPSEPEPWRVLVYPAQTSKRHNSNADRSAIACGSRGVRRTGFTIVDLLVSIVVVAILISILTPTLMQSYEAARRVVCASNIRQTGYALDMYIDDNDDELPDSIFLEPSLTRESGTDSHNTIFLRVSSQNGLLEDGSFSNATTEQWDGLGFLYDQGYLSHPGVFYCPSHHGSHPFDLYRESWARRRGTIAGNYQFRVDPNYRFRSQLAPGVTLVTDAMRTREDYNHRVGNNLLRADMSIAWYQDEGGQILLSLADKADEASAPEIGRAHV